MAKQARWKTDPELLAYSRELRDRWQEAATAEPGLLLPAGSAPGSQGPAKYDVAQLIAPAPGSSLGSRGHAARVGERQEPLEIVSEVVPDARRLDAS